MQHFTPAVIRDITGGEFLGGLPEDEITAVTTDSRTVTKGSLFVAIPGERVDGHDFIASAGEKGAACVLCSRFVPADVPQIKVPDIQAALGAMAAFYRSQFDIPVVGVTGSVGKTTAKEMIWAVLSAKYCTHKSEGNFNNEWGVPLTLFRLRPEHEAAVVEMGVNRFGEMTRLADMVHPQIAVFTLIGDAHLEFLGDRAGVLRAKSEMVPGMPANGLIIANGDDPLLRGHDFGRRKVLFGLSEGCDVRAVDVESGGAEGARCVIVAGDRRIPVEIPGFGQHMVSAALMGAAVGLELGLTDGQIQEGISRYETVGGRGRFLKTGYLTVLDDCYNANPTSAGSAVENLASLPGRHVAILGDMLELGPGGPAFHYELGQRAAKTGAVVVACGPLSREIARGAGEGALWFEDKDALIAALPEVLRQGDTVLVKASHSMGFERVVDALSAMTGG